MYIVIGGDGKQYGPISGDDLRQWIAEGRLSPQSLVKAESDTEFRPLHAFPEFAGSLGAAPAAVAAPIEWSARDYELDISGCIGRGWELFKANVGLLLGSLVLMVVLLGVAAVFLNLPLVALVPASWMQSIVFRQFFNVVMQLVLGLVNGPLIGGFLFIYLQAIRGRPAGIGDLFIGFQKAFAQLFLGNFAVAFFVGLCLVPFNIAFATKVEPILEQMRHTSNPQMVVAQMWPAIAGTLPILALCLLPLTYLTVNWQFTQALIIDKGMDFWTAMKTSWKMVHKHWFHVFGLTVVVGLINVAGMLVCCVGVLFAVPVTMAAMMYAYETIFGDRQAR